MGLNSRNVGGSSVAGGARPANSDDEMEFGEVESWAAICFGQGSIANMSLHRSIHDVEE